MSLSVISVPSTTSLEPAGLIVVLHGFGGNAEELASLIPYLNLPDYQFLVPNAPFPHPQVFGGRMWYDLNRPSGTPPEAYQDLFQSKQQLIEWLKSLESTTGVPLSRTILSGFSQGGAMTLDVGLNLPLAALICLSGYLHPVAAQPNQDFPPVLIVHGRQDLVVPLRAAQYTRETLTALGVAVQYQEFDMAHEISPAVIELMQSFVVKIMSEVKPSTSES